MPYTEDGGHSKQVLIPNDLRERLLANGRESAKAMAKDGDTPDHKPVVKLFKPDGGATWLLTELDPDNPDIAFGLCDLGMGSPELGNVSISEIEDVRGGHLGLPIERDEHWRAEKTISQYADEASKLGAIQV